MMRRQKLDELMVELNLSSNHVGQKGAELLADLFKSAATFPKILEERGP